MKNKAIINWFLILSCIAVILGLGSLATKTSLANLNTPTPNSGQLDVLEMIQSAQLSLTQRPDNRQIMEPQLTDEVDWATQLALDYSKPKPLITAILPTPKIIPTLECGIFEGQPSNITEPIENTWDCGINGQNYVVYAGAAGGIDPNQGVIEVRVMNQNFTRMKWSQHLTPTKSGPVRIQSWVGTRLTLTTKGGDTLYFDVAAQRFVSSLTEVVPTLTPLPNDYPTLAPSFMTNPVATPYP
jgi:hypothetical protein